MNSPLPELPTPSEVPAEAPADLPVSGGEMPRPDHAETDPKAAPETEPVAPPAPPPGIGAGRSRSRPDAAGLPLSPAAEPVPKTAPWVGDERHPLPPTGPRVIPAAAPGSTLPEEEQQSGGGGPLRLAEASGADAAHVSQQLSTAAATNLDAHLRALGEAAELLQRSAHLHETLIQLYRTQTTRLDKLEKQLASMSSSNR